jgi:hypothetical protein
LGVMLATFPSLSFKPASCSFCASLIQGTGCTVVNGKTEINNGNPSFSTYYKDNSWTGAGACPVPGSNCTTQVVLYNEQ